MHRICVNSIKKKLPHPVISVGNITWGGTGKTPCVMLLLERIKRAGKTSAVLMRGYGNDENKMLEKKFSDIPILSGKNRYIQGKKYCAEKSTDVFLLDDGFQQWGLHRDLDIVLINCLNPWGNGHMIPRGNLREPVSSLRRADIVVLSHINLISEEDKNALKKQIVCYVAEENIVEAMHKPEFLYRATEPAERIEMFSLEGQQIIIFSGIGTPRSLREILENAGALITDEFVFDDHYTYDHGDINIMQKRLSERLGSIIVTTEKDFMRNENLLLSIEGLYLLKITMEVTHGDSTLTYRLDRVLEH